MASVWWDEDEFGDIDTIYWRTQMTARQAFKRFGSKAGSGVVRAMSQSHSRHEKFKFLHCVMPRENAKPGALLARNFPVASYWINEDEKQIVSEGGFRSFPYITPRWSKRPNAAA